MFRAQRSTNIISNSMCHTPTRWTLKPRLNLNAQDYTLYPLHHGHEAPSTATHSSFLLLPQSSSSPTHFDNPITRSHQTDEANLTTNHPKLTANFPLKWLAPMATVAAASSAVLLTPSCALRWPRTAKTTTSKSKRERKGRALGDFRHLAQVVSKDVEFLKRGIGRGLEWVNKTLRIPEVVKTIDDVVWLRNLEDPNAPPLPDTCWPQPSYPGLLSISYTFMPLKIYIFE